MASVSNVTNAGTTAEEIVISLTDINSLRGSEAFGIQKIDWTAQQDVEGVVSGMLTSTETGFYTARTNVKTLDLICEGEIEGLVSGEYILTGSVGQLGYDEDYEFDPVQSVHPEDWLKSIYLNDTPVVGDGNLYNYQMVAAAFNDGTPDGIKDSDAFLAINDNEGVEKSRTINERLRGPDELEEGDTPDNPFIYHPKVYYVANSEINKIKVNIKIPSLKYIKMGNDFEYEELGTEVGTSLTFKFRYRAKFVNGSSSPWLPTDSGISEVVEGLMSNAYLHPVTIPLDSAYMNEDLLGWEVEVTRITLDSIEAHIYNQSYVDSLTEVFSSNFSFPNSAMVAMEFDAEYFSQVPTRAFDVRMLKIKVPVGYDPITKRYPANWDGTFQGEETNTEKQWTDNPAWVFYDLLTNDRYGLGKFVDELTIDKWTLYKIAQYCDTLVDDGNDGVEPRFSANVYINTREEAEKVLKDFASIFRSMVYFGLGNVHAVQDAPREPIVQFVNENVEDGNFTYASSSKKARATVVIVRYNDKTNYYKPALEFIEDAQAIKKYGYITKEITAFGCTSKAQAIRLARWILYTESYETEMINFNCGLEGMVLRPGDLIKVADSNRSELKEGGRIIEVSNTGILLDKNLPSDYITGDNNFLLSVTSPTYFYDPSFTNLISETQIDDIRRSHIQTHEYNPHITPEMRFTHVPIRDGVSGEAGPILGTKIEFHKDYFPFNDIDYNLRSGDLTWSVQDTAYGENQYSIVSVKEQNNFKYQVEGLEHVKEKYLAVESGITFTPPDPFDPGSTAPPFAPAGLQLVLDTAKDANGNNTNTKLIKYTITKPNPLGTTNGFVVYVKEGSTWDDDDLTKKSDGTISSIPKDEFLIGTLSVTVNPGQTLTSYYFPRYNEETYYFRVFSQNSVGVYSTSFKGDDKLVTNHFPIRDVKIHSLRLAGDQAENPSGHKSGFRLATGKDYTFTWDVSFVNSYVVNFPLEYYIYITKTSGPTGGPVVNASTLIKAQSTTNNTYIFSFEDNLNTDLDGSPFRIFDFIVEAKEVDGINTSSAGFTNSNGYDIYMVENPRPQDYNLTPRSLDRTRPGPQAAGEMMSTEQYVTSDGKLEMRLRSSVYNDLAGGIIYLSAQPFDESDFINNQPNTPSRIAALNDEEINRSGQWQILECPFNFPTETFSAGTATVIPGNIQHAAFEFNYQTTYYMAVKLIDSFDKARRDAGVPGWDKYVPVGFARYATVDGTDGTARDVNGIPCALCSGDQAVKVYPYRYTSANSDNPFFAWIRMNVNGQWEGNGVAAVKMLTKGDVNGIYDYKGFHDYACNISSIYYPGGGWRPNDTDAFTTCRFSQGSASSLDGQIDNSSVDEAWVNYNESISDYVQGLKIGFHTASSWELNEGEAIVSINAVGEVIPNRTRPLKGFRRFRVYFDPGRLPPAFAANSLASYSVVGQNAWNGAYETYDPDNANSIIYGSETIDDSTFDISVRSWLDNGDLFENVPGIWNHHPAGFAAGFGGLKKNQYYFDIHMGRMIDNSYLQEAFFGVLSANDYSLLAQYAESPSSAVNNLTVAQFDPNTFVTENL